MRGALGDEDRWPPGRSAPCQMGGDELGGEPLEHDPAPRSDWTMTSTPATTAAASSGRSRRRALKTVISADRRDQRPDEGAAISRWECSIQAWSRPAASSRRSRAASPGSRGPSRWRARARRRRSGRRSRRQRQPRAWQIGSTSLPSRPLRPGRCRAGAAHDSREADARSQTPNVSLRKAHPTFGRPSLRHVAQRRAEQAAAGAA